VHPVPSTFVKVPNYLELQAVFVQVPPTSVHPKSKSQKQLLLAVVKAAEVHVRQPAVQAAQELASAPHYPGTHPKTQSVAPEALTHPSAMSHV